jgi:hypothetical protein
LRQNSLFLPQNVSKAFCLLRENVFSFGTLQPHVMGNKYMNFGLLPLCFGYFIFYVLTGVSVKYFTGSPNLGMLGLNDVEYLMYSTTSSGLLCVGVILFLGWHKRMRPFDWKVALPILLSGVCTAFIIPSTTLLYAQPISVMIAMVLMRAGVLIVSRFVDQILLWQGLSSRKVTWHENAAVGCALLALSLQSGIAVVSENSAEKHFAFLDSPFVMGLLFFYLLSYFLRIYIMNYFKSVDPAGSRIDNRAYFGIEQLAASFTMILVTLGFLLLFRLSNEVLNPFFEKFSNSIFSPSQYWFPAGLSGLFYGMVAFFSVFIFMIRGRSATFAGLANRLTSLLAGTTATLVSCFLFASPWPSWIDWVSFGFIIFAVFLLAQSEKTQKKI